MLPENAHRKKIYSEYEQDLVLLKVVERFTSLVYSFQLVEAVNFTVDPLTPTTIGPHPEIRSPSVTSLTFTGLDVNREPT